MLHGNYNILLSPINGFDYYCMVFCKDLKSGTIFEWVVSISLTRVGHFMIITQRNNLGKENICCEKSLKSGKSHLLKRKSEIHANSAAKCPSNWVFKQMRQESHFLPLNHSTAVTKQIFRWCIYTNSYSFWTRSHSNYLLFICYCLYFSANLLNHEGKYWTIFGEILVAGAIENLYFCLQNNLDVRYTPSRYFCVFRIM